MKNLKIATLIACVCVVLGGCATSEDEHPSIGSGTDDFKESPCSCNEIEQRFRLQFVSA